MKLLFIPNWRVPRLQSDDARIQAPDKQVEGQDYWFFKYIRGIESLDIIDIGRGGLLRPVERKLKFYIIQPIRAFLRRNRYDVVVSHGAQSGLMYELLASFVWRKPKHVMFDIGGLNGDKDSALQTRILGYILRRRPTIVIHSSRQRSMYEKKYPDLLDRLHFFPFGVDCEYFAQFLTDAAPASVDASPAEEPYVLSFGYAKRDYDTLIAAWRLLPADCRLRIVGWKPESAEGMPANIEFEGKVPMDELIRRIRAAHFVVIPLPVFNYSYGQMSFLQSMSLGKCVVVSETVSSYDYLRNAPGAQLVEPCNAEALAEAIGRYLALPQAELDRLGVANRQFVETHFNEQTMAEALERVIATALVEQ